MTCPICSRNSCTLPFHSLEEQQAFEEGHPLDDEDDTDEESDHESPD